MASEMIGEMPKASIGNYKGVMLCNRPNEFGQQRAAENNGPAQFYSRVDVKNMNPMGWNPCQKLFPKSRKQRNGFNNVLNRHKIYLKQLEEDRKYQKEQVDYIVRAEEERKKEFMDKAQKQRQKIYNMKQNQDELFKPEEVLNGQIDANLNFDDYQEEKPAKLTGDNLSKMDARSQKSALSSKKSKTSKKSKPAWANTEKQLEDEKEAEIDDLLEFAYELDYDKYMDDFEIRQVFSIIKDRVKEIK